MLSLWSMVSSGSAEALCSCAGRTHLTCCMRSEVQRSPTSSYSLLQPPVVSCGPQDAQQTSFETAPYEIMAAGIGSFRRAAASQHSAFQSAVRAVLLQFWSKDPPDASVRPTYSFRPGLRRPWMSCRQTQHIWRPRSRCSWPGRRPGTALRGFGALRRFHHSALPSSRSLSRRPSMQQPR